MPFFIVFAFALLKFYIQEIIHILSKWPFVNNLTMNPFCWSTQSVNVVADKAGETMAF